MEPFETFEHAGVTVELHVDYDAGDPYTEMDQASRLIWLDHVARQEGFRDVETVNDERENAVTARWLTLFDGEAVVLPFQYHDYGSGGCRARLCDLEDCSGFVAVSRETLLKEWEDHPEHGTALECAEACARAEFETWAAWIEQDVYGYVVASGTPEHDSCWGFYGPGDEYVKKEARAAAVAAAHDALVRRRRERLFLLDPAAVEPVPSWGEFWKRYQEVAA